MSYVKTYNPGQIRMDLPTANYIHELPLLSFSDIHGAVNLSLVFNYALKAEGSNPYNIAPGYKLNLQKRLIIENGIPIKFQDESGKYVDLIGATSPYTFDDDSQRILRTTGDNITPYVIENPDFSTEKYNSSGLIIYAVDKYGTNVLTYTYSNNKLASILYRGNKIIQFSYYSSNNRLEYITFNGKRTRLTYTTAGVNVAHYSGVTYELASANDMDFTATASALEEGAAVSNKTQLVKNTSNNTIVISDLIGTDVVNSTSYKFPSAPSCTFEFNQVDITDYRGAKTRAQYHGKDLLYSYELSGTDVSIGDKYLGNIQIYKTVDTLNSSQSVGVQAVNDGTPMWYENASQERWLLDVSGNARNVLGYYMLTGWIRTKNNNVNYNDIKLCIRNQDGVLEFNPEVNPGTQWKFFAYKFYLNANFVDVYPSSPINVELKDLRLTFQPTHVLVEGATTHTALSEDIIIKENAGNGYIVIPFREATFYCKVNGIQTTLERVTASDILRWKLKRKRDGSCNEVYYDHCKDLVPNATELRVSWGDEDHPITAVDLGQRMYSPKYVYWTRTNVAETSSTANIVTTTYAVPSDISSQTEYSNPTAIGSQTMNANMDVIQTVVDGVTTNYTRANDLVTGETVKGIGTVINLCERTTAYSEVNGNPTITATDEFLESTVYTLDPVWGTVKSVTLPDGTVVTDEYDDDMCARMKRTFGNAAGRSNTHSYAGGNLSGLQSGSLGFTFGYTKGELSSIRKNSTSVEEHVHSVEGNSTYPNQTNSYYPAQSSALHSTSAIFDKYGRLTSIDGVLTNVYDIVPRFHTTTGALIPNADNGSALLAMTTDEMRSETAKFTYTNKGQLASKTVVKETNLTDKISQEEFTYDALDRVTKDICHYDSANSKMVTSTVEYQKTEDTPGADGKVSKYTYAVSGSSTATTQNVFDDYGRLEQKTHAFGGSAFTRTLGYYKTRVTSETHGNGSTSSTVSYDYDSCNRLSRVHRGINTDAYHYDQYGQLIREDNAALAKTYIYEYNDIGNLASIKAYPCTLPANTPTGTPVTTTFGYTDDRLTSFGGATIGYNAMGCPTSYEGKTATWTKGKLSRLFSGTLAAGSNSYNYVYNAFGQRVSRSYTYMEGTSGSNPVQVGQLTAYSRSYRYDHAGRLIAENISKTVHGEGTSNENIVFLYDESAIIGMVHTVGSIASTYYFQRNLQGDVVAIYNKNGTLKAKYLYDAWGNCTISSETTDYDVANANPIRYRGYYYDSDTGLYYCNARYYSPKWRRFISPDDTAYLDPESPNGLNLYCYCYNDPVNFFDPSGHWFETVFDLFSLGVSVIDVVINPLDPWAWAGLAGDAFDLIPFVTGAGEAIKGMRIVKKGVDVADATGDALTTIRFAKAASYADEFAEGGLDLVRTLDRTSDGFTISNRLTGTKIHKAFMGNGMMIPGTQLRVDGLYDVTKQLYELKPYNRRSLRRGVKQILNYNDKLLGGYQMIIVFY